MIRLCSPMLLGLVLLASGCAATDTPEEVVPEHDDTWYNRPGFRTLFGDFPAGEETYLKSREELDVLLARGREVALAGACGACHGLDAGDPNSALAGGRLMTDRFGLVRAANLTPARETGIGQWNIAQVVRALRASIDHKGRPLSVDAHNGYRWMSDRDSYAVSAYLLSLPPVVNDFERRRLGGIERKRWGLFSQHTEIVGYVPEPGRRDDWRYGKYLAHHVSRCQTCHTDGGGSISGETDFSGGGGAKRSWVDRIKGLFRAITELDLSDETPSDIAPLLSEEARSEVFGDQAPVPNAEAPPESVEGKLYAEEKTKVLDQALAEGVFPLVGPDIRGTSAIGLEGWTVDDIARYLQTGVTPNGETRDGRFCPWPFFSALSEQDRRLIAEYLKRI